MSSEELEKLRFPIGKFIRPQQFSEKSKLDYIKDLELFPSWIKKETEQLNDEQLDTPYRPDGWTIRQVVHHCADSHMNSFIRFKLALTEEKPTIKPYWEDRWAELLDSKMPIAPSLQIIESLHYRWVVFLKGMTTDDYGKIFIHPEFGREIPLKDNLALYSWHCKHHLAHITELKKRKGWL